VNLDYLTSHWRQVLQLTGQHLQLTAITIAIGLAIAIPLGIVAARVRPLTLPILSVLDGLYTVPSLAFLAILIPSVGIGRTNALIVLVAYSQLYLVRNIVAGLRGVDAATLEAARGIGMTPVQVFFRVQLPLALPVIVAGIRTALVTTISLATVVAWVNAGGLGTLLFDGINRDYPSEILAGAIAIAALALLADGLMRLLARFTAVARARRAAGA